VPFWNANPEAIVNSLTERNVKPEGSDIVPIHFDDGYKLYFKAHSKEDVLARTEKLESEIESVRVDNDTLRDLGERLDVKGIFSVTAYIPAMSLQQVNDSPHIDGLRPMGDPAQTLRAIAQALAGPA
jgi:hypothetical protein